MLSNVIFGIGGRFRGVSKSSRRKINCREFIIVDFKSFVMIFIFFRGYFES